MAKNSMAEALDMDTRAVDQEDWVRQKKEALEKGQEFIKKGLPEKEDPSRPMRRIDGKGLNMKVPYTTRLSPDTVRGIKHVVFENKMNGQQPTTEQALVEEALTEYLKIFNW